MLSYNKISSACLNLFFPNRCRSCRANLEFDDPLPLCAFCLSRVRPVTDPFCVTCGVPLPDGGEHCFRCRKESPAFDRVRSWAVFDGPVRDLLHRLKYSGREELAAPLSVFLTESWKEHAALQAASLIVPVPLHPAQERERGYNQAELLARELARKLGPSAPQVSKALRRVRRTPSQTRFSREERRSNLDGAFEAPDPASVRGKTVLVVDDVCTTGATLSECARALKKAGSGPVLGLTVARDI